MRLPLASLRARLARPWSSSLQRRRLLAIAGIVALLVTAAHRLVPTGDPRLWTLFHALVPTAVFALGAWSSGARRPTSRCILRGVAVVLLVLLAFGWINRRPLPLLAAFGLNFFVPLVVSTTGAAFSSPRVAVGRAAGPIRPGGR